MRDIDIPIVFLLSCLIGLALGAFLTFRPGGTQDKAYEMGVRDCMTGTANMTIIIRSNTADTTYAHP